MNVSSATELYTEKLLKWKSLCYMLFYHNINTHAHVHVHTQAELSLLWIENVPYPCCCTRFRATKELTFLLEKARHTFTSCDPFCALRLCSVAAHTGQPGPHPGPEEGEGTRGPERVWREHPLHWGSLPILPEGNFHSWCQLNSVNSLPPGKHPDSEMASQGLVLNTFRRS